MFARASQLLLAVAAAAVACSPAQTGTTDSPAGRDSAPRDGTVVDGVTVDALSALGACTMLATAKCSKLMSCSPADLTHKFGDVGTCEAREVLACTDALAAADTGATPGSAAACGVALGAGTCDDFLGGPPPAACLPQGSGTGTCAFAGQCSTSFCSIGANTLCGLCQDEPTVGQSCSTNGCGQSNLVCDGNNNICEAPVGSGAACNPTTPCDRGLVCVGDTKQVNGKCKPVNTTVGATCDQTRKNAANCSGDAGLTCNTNTNKCVMAPYVAAGATCGAISGVQTDCSAGASCVFVGAATTGKCVAPASDGSACSTGSAGPNCFNPARCIPTGSGTAGTCQLPGAQSCN